MKDPLSMPDEGIQEEVDTFMFEGHDTTTTALYFTTYAIGRHPDVQEKLHKEIDEIFGNSNRQVTNDDLNALKYLDCVIKESLRLYPPVPFISREITEDTKIGVHFIPKDSIADVLIYVLNRDEKEFPEPSLFKPERFLPENSLGRHAYSNVPFSAGRRNCIGQKFAMMEMKVMLANILRNFELSCDQTEDELKLHGELILRSENEIMVSLKSRN